MKEELVPFIKKDSKRVKCFSLFDRINGYNGMFIKKLLKKSIKNGNCLLKKLVKNDTIKIRIYWCRLHYNNLPIEYSLVLPCLCGLK